MLLRLPLIIVCSLRLLDVLLVSIRTVHILSAHKVVHLLSRVSGIRHIVRVATLLRMIFLTLVLWWVLQMLLMPGPTVIHLASKIATLMVLYSFLRAATLTFRKFEGILV